jgi:hypothetical protein
MKSIKHILLSFLLVLAFTFAGKAQDTEVEKKAPDLIFTVMRLSDGGYELKSRLVILEKKIDYPVSGAKIDYTIGADSLITINGNITDNHGYAYAYIKPGVRIPRDKEGVITAIAAYEGSDVNEAASAEAIFTEARIKLTCEMVDTVKTAKVEAYKINADGSETPLSGETVTVSVQRMFSKLPIGDASLDESGVGTVEFPNDLPGDSTGNLQVIAFMSEHETFGNIESSVQAQWGIPKAKVLVTHRALWTQIAPMWMIVSLTILLIGVWAHYTYVIIQLIYIKIKGKKTVVE